MIGELEKLLAEARRNQVEHQRLAHMHEGAAAAFELVINMLQQKAAGEQPAAPPQESEG